MPFVRVDSKASTTSLSPAALFDTLSGGDPTCLIMDCRLVLRTGILPRARVLRQKRAETLGQALERVIEQCMWEDPPEDQSRAILVGQLEDEGDDHAVVAEAAAFLRANFGCRSIFTLTGGASALERHPQYAYLLGMTPDRRAALPARLSERVFLGVTLSALDAPSLKSLGITHVVSLLNRQLALAHVAGGQHLLLRAGGVAREQGNDGLRGLLNESLPFILNALEALAAGGEDEASSGHAGGSGTGTGGGDTSEGGDGGASVGYANADGATPSDKADLGGGSSATATGGRSVGSSTPQQTRVLIHCEDSSKPSAASAIACAVLIAEGSSELSTVDEAVALVHARRPTAKLTPAAIAQLKACEDWLREGAPASAATADALSAGTMDGARAGAMGSSLRVAPKGRSSLEDVDDAEEVRGGHLAASRMMQEELLASLPADEQESDDDGDYAG